MCFRSENRSFSTDFYDFPEVENRKKVCRRQLKGSRGEIFPLFPSEDPAPTLRKEAVPAP